MSTPRNHLCPCGSGAKYKRCCGDVVALVEQRKAAKAAARLEWERKRAEAITLKPGRSVVALAGLMGLSMAAPIFAWPIRSERVFRARPRK